MNDNLRNAKIKILDYWFLMRPTLFFPLWTFFLAGAYGAGKLGYSGNLQRTIIGMFLLTMLMGAVYIINQIVDEKTDAKNDKLFFIPRGIIKKREARIESGVLFITSILGAFIIDLKLGLLFVIVSIFTGLLYSVKPFSWKDRPLLGVLTNFGGGWSIVACGWASAGYWGREILTRPLPYAIAIIAVFLLTTIPDMKGDAEVEKMTFAVKFGIRKTTFWALVTEISCAIISFLFEEWILFYPAILALPLFFMAAYRNHEKWINWAIKITVLMASLAICVVYPAYLLLLFGNYFFSKWYYRKRFNLEYPKFAA